MIIPSGAVRVLVATRPVDFRKGMDGLAALVHVKLLLWDGTGLVLVPKRLEKSSFRWPRIADGVMRLTSSHGEERERWMAIIAELQRHRFGRRSERLDPEQLALALEDVEQMLAAADAAAEKNDTPPVKPAAARKRAINRGALPLHLPREEIVIDVADKTCACCGVRRQFYDIQAKTPAPIGTADHLRGH